MALIYETPLFADMVKYWRTHLDVFILTCFPPFKFTKTQKIVSRAIGNNHECHIVASRGYGKSYCTVMSAFGLAVLYPGTLICIVSGTAVQACLTLLKLRQLANSNINIANELVKKGGKNYVSVTNGRGLALFKNGSLIHACAVDSLRGQRAKIIIEDLVALIDQGLLQSTVSPLKNYRRSISFTKGFNDYVSKTISMTSAVAKSNTYYDVYCRVAKNMSQHIEGNFVIGLNYEAAIMDGITDAEYFEKLRGAMTLLTFLQEYNSIFVGDSKGGVFPHELTDACRTLVDILLRQPKDCKSNYIITLDIATSTDRDADNSTVSVIKYTEKNNGTLHRKLVYMMSYHGRKLDYLASQIRILYHNCFPNTTKILYDARGIGDGFNRFLDNEWTDPFTGKLYPPLVCDDEHANNPLALSVLHPVRAVLAFNQQITSDLRLAFEKHALLMPISSSRVKAMRANNEIDNVSPLKMAVYMEVDALQILLGGIVAKTTSAGNVTYDCKPGRHKDRVSSILYGNNYIAQLERLNLKHLNRGGLCVGFATAYEDSREYNKATGLL